MTKPPIKKVVKAKATITSKLKDPGRQFYMVAIRDTISRGNVAEIKTLLKNVQDIQRAGGLDPLIVDLQNAINRAK